MLWFQKKTDEANHASPEVDYPFAPKEPDTAAADEPPGRQACLNHIQDTLRSNSRGVMLKLYLENFKQLNEIFGYDYCEALLSKIIARPFT